MDPTDLAGVVAAGSPDTAAAGAQLLCQGGNAVDAAVAAACVTFIAESAVSHTGGAGFTFYNEYAATVTAYHIDRGPVAVSGNVVGVCAWAADWGRLPLSTLLASAVRLARDGCAVTPSQASIGVLIKPITADTPAVARLFSPRGRFMRPGDRLRNPALAATLERLADAGPGLLCDSDNSQ